MKASKILKREIIIELFALLLFTSAVVYATITLKNKDEGNIVDYDGVVAVLDNKDSKHLEIISDGKAIEKEGTNYTITNNKDKAITYEIVISPSIHDESILDQIRISLDDIFISDLTSLERSQGGYVVGMKVLNPGYTKVHRIKYWYKLNSDKELTNKDIFFNYKIELV